MSSEETRTTTGASQGRKAMFDDLLKELQKQVALLEVDLRERAREEPFNGSLWAEYERAVSSQRTATDYGPWLDERLVQIAAAWVLGCVFVRFSEDNRLIPEAWLSGPGERLLEAQDRHEEHFRLHPDQNDRDWLKASFDAFADAHPTAAALFDERHNPMGEVTPSYEAAARLLAFWRERGVDNEVRYDFTDPELNTRFLGDLYQDLSEHARKTYALLQTPDFVEKFILDLTLEPAVEEFGLDPVWKHKPVDWRGELDEDDQVRGLRCIDPACGSGHFLLGLFERILAKWRELEPGTDRWLLIRRALESVHGADKNPYAASIARFRLLVAALKAGDVRELRRAPSCRSGSRWGLAAAWSGGRPGGRADLRRRCWAGGLHVPVGGRQGVRRERGSAGAQLVPRGGGEPRTSRSRTSRRTRTTGMCTGPARASTRCRCRSLSAFSSWRFGRVVTSGTVASPGRSPRIPS
ncbi:BREX-2 system adenine-specific DNA-methyltransferase PglX [Streptomyces sp. M10(2022)]